ncbi:MAG: hypothetical protein KatS3mg105_2277 [Gemmatales bacterium]|nr:MAG: hypothetical protein KatS3mg105_2277 [Gemmatales bacterium]
MVLQQLSALAMRLSPREEEGEGSPPKASLAQLIEKINEHRDRFQQALDQANQRAWMAIEIALAGEAFWEVVKVALRRQADQPCRQCLRNYLDFAPFSDLEIDVRQQCFRELRTARSEGLLNLGETNMTQLAEDADAFTQLASPDEIRAGEEKTLEQIAEAFRQARLPALGQLMSRSQPGQPHLLVQAFRVFLQRAVAADPELAAILPLAKLEGLEETQGLSALAEAFMLGGPRIEELLRSVHSVVVESISSELDLQAELANRDASIQELGSEVAKLIRQHFEGRRLVRPSDACCLADEADRRHARDVIAHFRDLPEEQRKQMPALLNAIGMLEMATGDFDEAQADFLQVAALLSDTEDQAQAHFNAYHAALERRDWNDALEALQAAIKLAPGRFAPFPAAKYEPERILGASGYGVTFLCRNKNTGNQVILKALRVDGLGRNLAEVFQEMRVLEQLDHPAILKPRYCEFVRGDKTRPFIVSDYFDGESLLDFIEQHGHLNPDEVLPIAKTIASALKAAHERGVLHRDLNPANVLIRKSENGWDIKVVDFGLSLKLSVVHAVMGNPPQRAHTAMGHSVSTVVDYAAPEQVGWVDGVAPGTYSDVYSFGCLCYYALLRTPEPDEDERETLPQSWRRFLGNCTARTLARRLENFSVVLERLNQIEEEAAKKPSAEEAASKAAPRQKTATSKTPKSPDEYNERGQQHMAQGNFEAALADFNQALQLNANFAPALNNRGEIYRITGNFEKALADFNQAIQLDPKFVSAYINRGKAFRSKGMHDRAIADFTRALRIDPKSADAYNNRGNAYADKGDYDRAIADYTEAIRLDPNLALAYMNRGLAYAKKGAFNAVIADCNEALRLNNKLVAAYFIRGAAYASKQTYDKAIADFTRVLKLEPKYALAYNDRGLALAAKGEYDRAIADYTQAMRHDPKLTLAFVNRAIAYRLKGEHDRSIAELTKFLRKVPKHAMAFTNRGIAYMAKQDYDRAIADFTEALWIDPNHTEAYNRRVEAVRLRNERAKAIEERRRKEAAAREERERRQSRATAHFTRGQMHFDNGHFDRAINEFTEALKHDPTDAFVYYQRGRAYAATDELDRAVADYTEALTRNPKLVAAYYDRGVAYRLKGNYARAVADFTEVIRLDPKHALAYRSRGMAYAGLGEQAKAKADYEEAVKLDPSLKKT